MRKLFTLIAFLTCFLGANAIEIVDAEVDFSKFADGSAIKFYGWGASGSAQARLSIKDGCLHFHSEEATDPSWDCQFHPIGGFEYEDGVTYTLHYKVKGTVQQNISALGFGTTPYGQFPITTEWVEGTFDYVASGNGDGAMLFQCGDYVGDWDIAYLKVTHEGKEEKPVQWANILENGDAEGAFAEFPCAYSKEWGRLMNGTNANAGGAAIPEVHVADIEDLDGNKVFACHAKAVEPPLLWAEAGEQWGQQHAAGDEMPDNTWQNQFWIAFPRAMKDGEQLKISFRYKASKAVTVSTQDHTNPGDYLGGGKLGNIEFTTEWQTYEKQFSAAAGVQSIAFNVTGDGTNWKEDIDFYFDDLNVSEMVLDKGFFAASTNTESGLVDYDFDNAVEFRSANGLMIATVGTKGKPDSWVNEVMISTVRGNDKAFKAGTLKVSGTVKNDEETWLDYTEGSNAKTKLPAAGVWTISIDTDMKQINFIKLEGEADKEPVDIIANETVVVVNGVAREDLSDTFDNDGARTGREEEGGTGETWDNQFFIIANRVLQPNEVTIIEFDYVATAESVCPTGTHAQPGEYRKNAFGDVSFTTEEQHFKAEYTVPDKTWGGDAINDAQSISFDMAVIKEAADYTIKNVKWYTKDDYNAEGKTLENLIDATGTKNFIVKIGAGTTPYQYGTDPSGIANVVNKTVDSSASFNLAGQRVSKDYKGIVVKNGKKYIAK